MSLLRASCKAVLLGSLCLALAPAQAQLIDKAALRKTRTKDLTVDYQRVVLANGQVVLLAPDPHASSVVVDQAFLGGAVVQPPGKGGLAHVVEHLLAFGWPDDVDYKRQLEAVGGFGFNAFTTTDVMWFNVQVPPEQLPLALWVCADRVGHRPATIDDADLARVRKVIAEERAIEVDEVPFGLAGVELTKKMYPAPHPLHGRLIGLPQEVDRLTVADVKGYVSKVIAPANGILAIVGNFDPKVAREWLDKTVGALPPGKRVEFPPLPAQPLEASTITVMEERSRRPRVTFAWRLGEVDRELANALEFGALLLTVYTDGFLGIEVSAEFTKYPGGGDFEVDVTMDHGKSKLYAHDDAEALLRYLTLAPAPDDVFSATLLAWDRVTMERLETLSSRASELMRLELEGRTPADAAVWAERQWALTPQEIQPLARKALESGRYTLYVRPTRPRPERAPRE